MISSFIWLTQIGVLDADQCGILLGQAVCSAADKLTFGFHPAARWDPEGSSCKVLRC